MVEWLGFGIVEVEELVKFFFAAVLVELVCAVGVRWWGL